MMQLFSLLFLINSVLSVTLQVDLGSESMRASMMERGNPVSIVMNGLGRRFTPAVVSLVPEPGKENAIFLDSDVDDFKRYVGDTSISQRFPMNSVRFLPMILGKNYSSKLVDFFSSRNATMPFDADDDKYLELIAPPEFFAAQLIQSAERDCKNTKVNRTVDELALVIPKFLTHHQRTAFIRSAKLATYNPKLIETSEAVGTLFAVERSQLFKDSPLYVCFIDIGASQIQVSVQEFKSKEVKTSKEKKSKIVINELGYAWTDLHGSYSIDCIIAKSIRRKIEKLKPNAVFDDKSVQKILLAARRVKHELTLQPKVSLFLEDLVHGFDMTFTYSMDRLKKKCKEEISALNKTFYKAFWDAGFDEAADIDRIELIGGGTRSPLFIDAINETFGGKVQVLRSLNTEEAAVIGAGYALAASRKNYLSNDIIFKGIDAYNITKSISANERIVQFYYAADQQLPLGIKPFIRAIDIGQNGKYFIEDGRVHVGECRKLTLSGLYNDKRYNIQHILHAFEEKEQAESKYNELIHEFDTFLIETREKLTKDEIVLQVSTNEERDYALKLIANMQYLIQNDQNKQNKQQNNILDDENAITEDSLKRMKAEIEDATRLIFKKATDKSDAPIEYQKLSDLLDSINRAVDEDWPKAGLKPKKKLLRSLGRACAKTERWLLEHEDNLEGVTVDDISLMYERLHHAFDIVKNNLKQKHRSSLEL